jgi:hypothetical protein
MSSHDFKGLHDKEFEALCADLLGVSMSIRFERFKPGPDQGVDARCFEAGGGEIILQCKHRPASSITQLARHLREEEAPEATCWLYRTRCRGRTRPSLRSQCVLM